MYKLVLKGICVFGAAMAVACGGGGDLDNLGSSSSSSGGGQGGNGSGGANTGGANTGGGNTGNECMDASECDAKNGVAPCGAWACNAGFCEAQSPGCTDADHDGYGSGASCMCAGLDCDDANEQVGSTAPSQSCYSGPSGTQGVGTCQAGTHSCTAGQWSPCAGEVTPSGEACNTMDDDCNGVADDNLGVFSCGLGACVKTVNACDNGAVGVCSPAAPPSLVDGPNCNGMDDDCDGAIDEDCKQCVPVSLAGNDATADGTFNNPFKSIQAAIDWTVANNGPSTVCVAAGQNCGTMNLPSTGSYVLAANTTITMADGISVLGNYESTQWTRCAAFTTTVIQPQTPEGIGFPNQIAKTTVLDGFRIDRMNAPTTAAITLDGAKNAILSNITISNTPAVMSSYGINVINGAELIVSKSRIDAGSGSVESIGIRSVGSAVHLQNNCLSLDAQGRCDDFCGNNPSIRGRTQGGGTGLTHAVLLQDSPNSSIETSALCANEGDQGSPIRIAGNGAGILIRANLVNAFGGAQHSHGIWMEDCAGGAPWIVDNHYIAAVGDSQNTLVDAIRSIGDCHPVIDSNREITGGGEGNASNTNAVHCGANIMGTPSKCVVLGNANIRGSASQFPPSAVGVRCDNGGCMKIAENTITGRGGVLSYGIFLEKTGALVDRNAVRGGCASQEATGVFADDAYTRIQNNIIFGFTASDCPGGNPPQVTQSSGLRILGAAGIHEIDVHSNTIVGGGNANAACTSRAIALGAAAAAPSSALGIFRNNILRAGACMSNRIVFEELVALADPRIFENNDLDPTGMPSALYYDEAGKALISAAEVNALMDTSVSGTLSADALFVNYPADLHLMVASPCAGAGTSNAAPLYDFDNKARDAAKPSIGAFEP